MVVKNKICRVCGLNREIKWFYKNTYAAGGYEARCKTCKKEGKTIPKEPKEKEPKKKSSESLMMKGVQKEDYCSMFSFFERTGYDMTRDIHEQFCEKYGLKPRNRRFNQKNRFQFQDCK